MAVSTVATEPEVLLATAWTPATVGALSVSCLLGVSMSYFAFLCRAAVSATSFTVIGNVCKVLTVLINVCIWDKHATPAGLGCLLICLVAAFLYKPSPLRADRQLAQQGELQQLVTEGEQPADEGGEEHGEEEEPNA